MNGRRQWLVALLAAGITVLAGRWGLGLFTVSEYVHFSVNFPTAKGEPQMPLDALGGPWSRIEEAAWNGYPKGGLLVWGQEEELVVDIGKRGWLKALLQPSVLLISSHWIRNVGLKPYRLRMELDLCGLKADWLTFERAWDDSSKTTTRKIAPKESFNMDWRIQTPVDIQQTALPCRGGLRLYDAENDTLLTLFPITIKKSNKPEKAP